MNKQSINYIKFDKINLNDPFFNSLKGDYPLFEKWFNKKSIENKSAFILEDNGIKGFLFLKKEEGLIEDVTPSLDAKKWLKVGTFKIDAHGTKLGERFIKIMLDIALERDYNGLYVTIFEKHQGLIELLKMYGFVLHGNKGNENVYIKTFDTPQNDIYKDYPKFNNKKKKYLLAIAPEYHTILLPDSRLRTEKSIRYQDISYTNSIQKIYLSKNWGLKDCCKGDIIVMYRMGEPGRKAEYTAVATSILVVDQVRKVDTFKTFEEFYNYSKKYTALSKTEINKYWESEDKYHRKNSYVLKATYNVALNNRITRHDLIEKIGIERNQYWGFIKLEDQKFIDILKHGGIDESTYGY